WMIPRSLLVGAAPHARPRPLSPEGGSPLNVPNAVWPFYGTGPEPDRGNPGVTHAEPQRKRNDLRPLEFLKGDGGGVLVGFALLGEGFGVQVLLTDVAWGCQDQEPSWVAEDKPKGSGRFWNRPILPSIHSICFNSIRRRSTSSPVPTEIRRPSP